MSGVTSPAFSIVIPTFNRAALLRRTLESVFAQAFTDYEVIVVDDGSKDSTPDVLASLGDRIRVLRQENGGPSAARNLGISSARGRYVCTVDSDDLWFPWTLETFHAAIQAGQSPTMVTGEWIEFREEQELESVRRTPPSLERFSSYLASSAKGFHVSSGAGAYLRSALLAVSGFDVTLQNAEDHDLALRLGSEPGFVKIQSPPIVGYRQHAGSIRTLDRSAAGLGSCIDRERRDGYPGAKSARRRLLTLHTRPLSLACVAAGRADLAWTLYSRTFTWNVAQGRLRYTIGLPLLALKRRCAWSRPRAR